MFPISDALRSGCATGRKELSDEKEQFHVVFEPKGGGRGMQVAETASTYRAGKGIGKQG